MYSRVNLDAVLRVLGIGRMSTPSNNPNKPFPTYTQRKNTYTHLWILCLRLRQACCHLELLNSSDMENERVFLSMMDHTDNSNKANSDELESLIEGMDSITLTHSKRSNEIVLSNNKTSLSHTYQSTKVHYTYKR